MKNNLRILCYIIGCALSAPSIQAEDAAFGLSKNKTAQALHQTIQSFCRNHSAHLIPMMKEVEKDTVLLQSWSFRIPLKRSGTGAPREIQRLTNAFSSAQDKASSYIVRQPLPEPAPFLDVRAVYGQAKTIKCAFTDEMNIHSLVFEDADASCNSYILSWWPSNHAAADSLWLDGFIYECYGHTSYRKTDIALPVPEYNPLTGRRIPDGTFREYVALRSKITHMLTRAQVADSTEMAAIALALEKEMSAIDVSFTYDQYDNLNSQLQKLRDYAAPISSEIAIKMIHTFDAISKNGLLPENRYRRNTPLEEEFLSLNNMQAFKFRSEEDTLIMRGEHYLGNRRIPYFERGKNGRNFSGSDWSVNKYRLSKGVYRLKMAVRGEDEIALRSIKLYVQSGYQSEQTMTRQFYKLPFCGHTGGDIWAQAKAEVEKAKAEGREPSPVDLSIAQANDGKGYGWNWLIVDNIEVDDDNRNLQYGVIIGPKVGEGYSVCDIILERVGDLEE